MNDNKLYDEKLNSNDAKHPKGRFEEVPIYSNVLSANRRNFQPDGFDYDADFFENLIDSYASIDEILSILSIRAGHVVEEPEVDKFCKILYGYSFRETYKILLNISNVHMKKIIRNLGASGNATALALTSKHLMKMEEDEKKDAINIRIINDLENK